MDAQLQVQFDKLKKMFLDEGLTKPLVDWDEKMVKPVEDITDEEKLEQLRYRFRDEILPLYIEHEQDEKLVDDNMYRFNFDEILVEWVRNVPFFAEISRWIKKRPADTLPGGRPNYTAAMMYNFETDEFEMLYNPRWFCLLVNKHKEQNRGTKMVEFVINHELYHMILRHVTARRRTPHFAWNIATDAAINSIIVGGGGIMPPSGILPGRGWDAPKVRKLTEEEEMMQKGLSDLIVNWPLNQSSDWYFSELMKWSQETGHQFTGSGMRCKGGSGSGELSDEELQDIFDKMGVDSHDGWDEVTEEQREIIEGKVKEMIRRGVRKADSQSNGWGNIPTELRKAIKASVDDQIDWESVLRNFIGTCNRGHRSTSIKKINKRYAYIHPGVKRGYMPKIAVAMDQSGSVADEYVQAFFNVLGSLARKVSFTLIPFDSTVDRDNVMEWRKGSMPKLQRTRSGGTNFDAVTEFLAEPGQRDKFDGLIMLTDGECNKPKATRCRRAWVICPNHQLYFKTDELVINMTTDGKRAGPKADQVTR